MEALRPTASIPGDGPWPTLAGKYVYDSRIDPINDLAVNERRPILVVFTEEDNRDPGQKRGGPPYKSIVDLCLELSIAARIDTGNPDDYEAGIPQTDPELEASLDLLESQALFVLHYGPTGALWRKLTGRKVTDINSLPHRTSEEGVRLAERTVRLKMHIPDECFEAAPPAALTGLDRLPEPLKSIIAALADTAYGKTIGTGLAAEASTMPVATKLEEVGLSVDLASKDPDGVPDGTIDWNAEVDDLNP